MALKSKSVLTGSRSLARSRSTDNLPTSQSQVNIQMMSHTLTIREVCYLYSFFFFFFQNSPNIWQIFFQQNMDSYVCFIRFYLILYDCSFFLDSYLVNFVILNIDILIMLILLIFEVWNYIHKTIVHICEPIIFIFKCCEWFFICKKLAGLKV